MREDQRSSNELSSNQNKSQKTAVQTQTKTILTDLRSTSASLKIQYTIVKLSLYYSQIKPTNSHVELKHER